MKEPLKSSNSQLIYDPGSTIVRLRLAAEYLKLGHLSEAIEHVEEALEKDKSSEEGLLLLGGLYTSLRMYNKATDLYVKLLELYPNHLEGHLHMGALFAEQKNYKKAEKIFLKLLKHPDNDEPHVAHYYLGRIYFEKGKEFLQKAEEAYKSSLRLKPNYENSILALVKLYESQGKQEKAVQLARSFHNKFGPKQRVVQYLSAIYLERKNYEEALVQLRYLESFDKTNLDIKVKLALILIEQKRLREAISKLEEILVTAPDSDKIRFYLAVVYKELGETFLSIDNFIKVPNLSPYYVESMVHVASLYKQENKLDEAIGTLKKALLLRTDSPQLYAFYASLLSDKKDYKTAINTLSGAVEAFPKNTQLRFFLGTMFDRTNQLGLTIIQNEQDTGNRSESCASPQLPGLHLCRAGRTTQRSRTARP